MESECVFIDPEEDEIFFGPVTDREKQVSARIRNRKTIVFNRTDASEDNENGVCEAEDRRRHVHPLTPYQRPSVSKLSLSEMSHCSISEEAEENLDELDAYEVFSTPKSRISSVRMSGLDILEEATEAMENGCSDADIAAIKKKLDSLVIEELPHIEIDLTEEEEDEPMDGNTETVETETQDTKGMQVQAEAQVPSTTEEVRDEHNYSTPVKTRIDKSILKTPKSLVKADKDGGYLSVLSEIAIVKAVEEKDIPEICITEPTPEKLTVSPAKAAAVKAEPRKFQLVYHTPVKGGSVDVGVDGSGDGKAMPEEAVMVIKEEEDNDDGPKKLSVKEETAWNLPLDPEEEVPRREDSPVESEEVPGTQDLPVAAEDEKRSEGQLDEMVPAEDNDEVLSIQSATDLESCDELLFKTPCGKEEPKDEDLFEMSVDIFECGEMEKEASKVIHSFRSEVDMSFAESEMNPCENSFINTDNESLLDDSFLQPRKQTPMTRKQQQLLRQIMGKGTLVDSPRAVQDKIETEVVDLKLKSDDVKPANLKKAAIVVTPGSNRQIQKAKSEQKSASEELFAKPLLAKRSQNTFSTGKKIAKMETAAGLSGKKGDGIVRPPTSKIPTMGSVSKLPTSKGILSSGKSGIPHPVPVRSAQKCLQFSEVESPVNAYIKSRPVPLVANVKEKAVVTSRSTQQKEELTKKLWLANAATENRENADPNTQGAAQSQVAGGEYQTSKKLVVEKPVESRLPRLASSMRKLIPEKSPKVMRHEGRRLEDADVSVLVSYAARNTCLFK